MRMHTYNWLKPRSKRIMVLESASIILVLLLIIGGILWQVRPPLLQHLPCSSCGATNNTLTYPTIYVARHTDISGTGLNPPPIQTFLYAINGRTGKVQQTTDLQNTSFIYYQKIISGVNYEIFNDQSNVILLATDLHNGATLWRDTVDQQFTSAVASSSILYIYGSYGAISGPSSVIAIDLKNGDQLWEKEIGNIAYMLLADMTLIVQETYEDDIIALSADSGQELWKHRNPTNDNALTPVVEGSHAFFGYLHNLSQLSLLELDEHTGMLLWQNQTEVGNIASPFSIRSHCILIETANMKLTVLRETDKSVLWSYTLQSSYNFTQYNHWIATDDIVYALSAQIDPQTFAVKRIMTAWQIDTGKKLFQTTIDINGDFNVYRLDKQLLFTSTNRASTFVDENMGPLSNDIEARQAQTGKLLWHKHLGQLPLYNRGSGWDLSVIETSDAHSDDCSLIGCPYTSDLRGGDTEYYMPATDLHSNDRGFTTFYIPGGGEQEQAALYLTLYQNASQSYVLYAIDPQTGTPLWQVMPDTLSARTLSMVKEFLLPTAANTPKSITPGPDGNLWFTELPPFTSTQEAALQIGKIGRVTPAGKITEFALPLPGTLPEEITAGSDGNLWFTETLNDQIGKIGRITPTGQITEFVLPSLDGGNSRPRGIVAGQDGNIWFTEVFGDKVGRITPTGKITEFALPGVGQPGAITAGPDGNLWFTSSGLNTSIDTIGRITPAGEITEFPISTGNSYPDAITAGPDGNLWFIEIGANQIGRITPLGVIDEFILPTSGSLPLNITSGPDSSLWFTSSPKNQIRQITPTGQITGFTLPTVGSLPDGITLGPDGNLWFTETLENQAGKIGRIIIRK